MKTKISMTWLKSMYPGYKIFRCGYVDLDPLINSDEFTYYNCGVYGWNCDIYVNHSNELIITTGYRNMRGDLIPRALLDKYVIPAKVNSRRWDITYDERENIRSELKAAFFKALSER